MTWLLPEVAWALLGVPLLAALLVLAARRHGARLDAALGDGLARRTLPPEVRRRRAWRDALAVAGTAGLVVALADPRAPAAARTQKAEGIDLVIALDLSRSMDAQDVDPSRLERARREIEDLLGLLAGDRVGLVVFAGGAWPRMPLTLDHAAMRLVTREADTRMFEAQGSLFGEALDVATELLGRSGDTAGRAVLVVSDGEAHDPAEALAAADRAAQAGVAVYGLVVGTGPAPLPQGDGRFVLDPKTRQRVMSEPSEALLQDMARRTGGAVARSVPSDADVQQLLTLMRSTLAAGNARDLEQTVSAALFQVALGPALLALLLAAWLGDGAAHARAVRRRPTLPTAALVGALMATAHLVRSAPAEAGPDGPSAAEATADRADALYREGRFAEAAAMWESLAQQAPQDPGLLDHLAAARYRAGDYAGAARAWARLAEQTGSPDAAFNAGNAEWMAGRLDRAAARYDEALAASPEHAGAATNRQLLQQELEQRRQQQPSNQPSGEGGDPPPPDGGEPGEPQATPPGQGQTPPGQGGDPSQAPPAGEGEAEQGQAEPQPGGADPEQAGQRDPSEGGRAEAAPSGTTELPSAGEPGEDAPEGGAGAGEPTGGPAPDGPAAAAARTLDSVEEGRPRVFTPGRGTDKPW